MQALPCAGLPVRAVLRQRRRLAVWRLLAADEIGVHADQVRERQREQLQGDRAREQGVRDLGALRRGRQHQGVDGSRQPGECRRLADRDRRDADRSGCTGSALQTPVTASSATWVGGEEDERCPVGVAAGEVAVQERLEVQRRGGYARPLDPRCALQPRP